MLGIRALSGRVAVGAAIPRLQVNRDVENLGADALFPQFLHDLSAGFAKTMATQTPEIDALKTAILNSKKSALPPDPALVQQAQELQKAVAQREQLLAALRAGMFKPGEGHSDRLQLVARSIPAPAWVTEIKADQGRFEVSGFTLDPAALNDWV